MPKHVDWEHLEQHLQLDLLDPMCRVVPNLEEFTTKAWEFILLNLDDCYTICHGPACHSAMLRVGSLCFCQDRTQKRKALLYE